jgi:penicillin amidase
MAPPLDARRPARWRRRLLLLVALTALALAGAVFRLTRFPKTTGTVAVKGTDGPVEILRGPYGVPHVLATTPRDAYFGLGFCEAQDRTAQLELFRRAANGTLAELIGEGGLANDRFSRTVGMRRIADRQIENASPEARVLTQSFAEGINAGFRSLGALPPELAILGAQPAAWTPGDVMALARLVSYGLAKDHQEAQVLFSRIVARVGEERARAFLPLGSKRGPGDRACLTPVLDGGADLVDRLGLGMGCSNWIVAGSRTASGKPLFAYDSHQTGAKIPGEVYLAHLVGGAELDVAGGVIVGLPGFYAGATRETAFAPTNVGADAQELVSLEIEPGHPDRYRAAGKSFAFTTREETIAVKGRAPVALEVRETVFGPVVSDPHASPPPQAGEGARETEVLALKWAGARPELRLDGYVTMPLAKTWESFRTCLGAFEAAAQHYGFAHRDGTIAYQVIGPLLKREKPVAAWPTAPASVDQEPLLTLDELPHLVNPKDGFIVTANQKPIHADEPYYFGRAFIPSARHDRLVEAIEARPRADLAALEATGLDLVSPHARRVTPTLVAILREGRSEDARFVADKLAAWDSSMTAGAVEPLLYHALVREIARALLEDELGSELAAAYASRPELSQERLAAILEDPGHALWKGSRQATVERAALAALVLLEGKLGPDRARWRWDSLHTVTLEGYLHDATTLLDAGPFGVPGDDDTPFRFGHKTLHEPFRVETVALLRLFVDLADPSAIDAIVSSGEQGWPYHAHWKDQLPLWLEGKTIRIPREVAAIRATCPERLLLEPVP